MPIIWNGAAPAGAASKASRPDEFIAFQFSDAPPAPVTEGVKRPTDRLPPGQGIVRWIEVLQLLAEKGYTGT